MYPANNNPNEIPYTNLQPLFILHINNPNKIPITTPTVSSEATASVSVIFRGINANSNVPPIIPTNNP